MLYTDVKILIEEARSAVAQTVNAGLTMLYWNIGKRINDEILKKKRADYGKQIVASLMRQLSWTHFTLIIPINNELQRDFYAQMCRIELWSVRTLRKKIDSMLFERTAISKRPEKLAKLELKKLRDNDKLSPDLVFRSPYILDFLNLKDTYQEQDLEKAILNEIERFILELGKGFTFVERDNR